MSVSGVGFKVKDVKFEGSGRKFQGSGFRVHKVKN